MHSKEADKPIAGLLRDLKANGLRIQLWRSEEVGWLKPSRQAKAHPIRHYTSRITGTISGRREVCFVRNRFRSTRIFS